VLVGTGGVDSEAPVAAAEEAGAVWASTIGGTNEAENTVRQSAGTARRKTKANASFIEFMGLGWGLPAGTGIMSIDPQLFQTPRRFHW
jgi:hypothetical protein